jgi:hypothetical protein
VFIFHDYQIELSAFIVSKQCIKINESENFQVFAKSRAFGSALLAKGLKPNDSSLIGIYSVNRPEVTLGVKHKIKDYNHNKLIFYSSQRSHIKSCQVFDIARWLK